MYYISRYDSGYCGGNGIIYSDYYQNSNFNNNLPKLQKSENEIKLSKKNKNLANYLTKETLKHYKIESSDKKLKNYNEGKKTNNGLDYFI